MSTKESDMPAVTEQIPIGKKDLVEAWSLIENLVVSLDQIGGALDDAEDRRYALEEYLSPGLIEALNKARMKLGAYIPDAEAEALSERAIPYWNYKGMTKGKYTRTRRT